jgi:hypothetical protein
VDPPERTRWWLRQASSLHHRSIGRDLDVLSLWRACRRYAFACGFQMTRYSLAIFNGEVRSSSRSGTSLGPSDCFERQLAAPCASIKTRSCEPWEGHF